MKQRNKGRGGIAIATVLLFLGILAGLLGWSSRWFKEQPNIKNFKQQKIEQKQPEKKDTEKQEKKKDEGTQTEQNTDQNASDAEQTEENM